MGKPYRYYLLLLLHLLSQYSFAQNGMGTDFWTGYGYISNMSTKSSSTGSAQLSLYITAGSSAAVVTIDIPAMPIALQNALGFPRTANISANTTYKVSGFPTGDANDATNLAKLPDLRLFYTGISNRAIHISSTQPISIVQQIFGNNNTNTATALLPSSVYGNKYVVQSMGGLTNSGYPNSNFFILANQDSTEIVFTPTNDIVDSTSATIFTKTPESAYIRYHKDSSYKITLHKGQIFNAMGYIENSIAVDLSGTRIVSTNPQKKIAVFGGNGRVIINTPECSNNTGSDNLFQQILPTALWGKEYLTVPTKTMEKGIYRITVMDTTTDVYVNNSLLPKSELKKGAFYELSNNTYNSIKSSKKIGVTQYIVSAGCPWATSGNSGSGDPEMISISSLEYGIKNIALYTPPFTSTSVTGGSYINIIIKKDGINSFVMNYQSNVDTGSSSYVLAYGSGGSIALANAFKKHPADTNYYFAKIRVATGSTYFLRSDSSFNAIVYSVGTAESAAYNACFNYSITPTTYQFIGNGNWTNPTNWFGNKIPPNSLPMGSEIIISGTCALNVPQTIEDGARLVVETGGKLIVNGNLAIAQ